MSFFNFLNKQHKEGEETQSMELPPLPELPSYTGTPFGEITPSEAPHLEETGLPPLPSQLLPAQTPMPQTPVQPRMIAQPTPSPTGLPPLEETLGLSPRPRKILDELPPPPDFEKSTARFSEEENVPSRIPGLELHGIPSVLMPMPAHVHIAQGPLFVRMDQYRSVLQYIEEIKVTFKSEENFFLHINDMKNSRDQKFETLHNALEDLQRKLLFIDKTIFER
ncbi:hypothetical protein HY772_01055 [Candidatus Woesearchaeota archaeon]|nr:hypothetical protein [Candidatus Woesearchaeota archaeon]